MKLYSLFLLLLFTPTVFASNTCPPEDTYLFKSIECCLSDQLSQTTCEGKISALPKSLLDAIKNEKQKIKDELYPTGKAPNCFWLSTSFHSDTFLNNPKTVYEPEFLDFLNQSFGEAPRDQLEYGDLIYYQGFQTVYPDVLHGEGLEVSKPFHAGVYVGDGLILQKENSSDDIFSLTTIDSSFAGYKGAFEETGDRLVLKFAAPK